MSLCVPCGQELKPRAPPNGGGPVEELPLEFREWVIEFGSGVYVDLYHYDGKQIVILAIRHGREAGY